MCVCVCVFLRNFILIKKCLLLKKFNFNFFYILEKFNALLLEKKKTFLFSVLYKFVYFLTSFKKFCYHHLCLDYSRRQNIYFTLFYFFLFDYSAGLFRPNEVFAWFTHC